MPSVNIYPPSKTASGLESTAFPQTIRTPSGLAIIEFQGSVVVDGDVPQEPNQKALPLGHMVFPAANDASGKHDLENWDGKRVFLFVGKHQRLTGEVKKLGKALAVIRRRDAGGASAATDDLEIAEVITHKVLFASRPEPVGTEQHVEGEG